MPTLIFVSRVANRDRGPKTLCQKIMILKFEIFDFSRNLTRWVVSPATTTVAPVTEAIKTGMAEASTSLDPLQVFGIIIGKQEFEVSQHKL